MKIFLIYRFTGEEIVKLEKICNKIIASLEKAKHICFCSLSKEKYYKKNKFTRKQSYLDTMKEIDNYEAVLVFIKSNKKNEEILVEVGYAVAKGKKIFLAIKNGVRSELIEQISDKIIKFDTVEDLCKKLSKLN
ncbi:MAG: hypothetical protein KJ697_05205 [Nanoarchaeota archaeon]|nr:hypothetical protein [Nanoarchaeota archaeon]MBU4124395.1 hypothetical protein [Nanoarchaeota archaeon]